MKKFFFLFMLLPCVVFGQHGVSSVFKSVEIIDTLDVGEGNFVLSPTTDQLSGYIEYSAICAGFDTPSSLGPDTCWFAKNITGTTMTVDSIRVESSTDDQDVIIVSKAGIGGTVSRIDSCGASTDGVNCFYGTATSIDDASIAANETIGLVKPTTASTTVQLTIYYHYTKQER